jgi:hypothetical protein
MCEPGAKLYRRLNKINAVIGSIAAMVCRTWAVLEPDCAAIGMVVFCKRVPLLDFHVIPDWWAVMGAGGKWW